MSDNNLDFEKINNDLNNQDKVLNTIATNEQYVESKTEDITKRRVRLAQKRKRRIRNAIITISIVVVLSVAFAIGFLYFISDFMGIRFKNQEMHEINIEQGTSASEIAETLDKEGVINSAFLFKVYCKLSGKSGQFKYGVYNFSNELGYKEIATMLQENGAKAETVKVTIPERASLDDIMRILEEKGVCTKADFKDAMRNGYYDDISFVKDIPTDKVYYRFEGYLFPDTYEFYNYDSRKCAESAIRKMLKRTEELLTEDLLKQIEADNKTLHEVLTMASIVELEASASVDEMPKVAAVFYNRLVWDEPQRLGSSPTMEYPYGDGRYDTNKVEGLPPGPLCSPSLAAIKAAIYPEKNFSYTYFVTDSDNKFYYNNTYREHNQTIASLKSQGKWLG